MRELLAFDPVPRECQRQCGAAPERNVLARKACFCALHLWPRPFATVEN